MPVLTIRNVSHQTLCALRIHAARNARSLAAEVRAITSTQGWQKRLGFRRWKRLHRLVYLAGGLASFHFLLRFKTPRIETIAWMSVVAALLLVRLVRVARLRMVESR